MAMRNIDRRPMTLERAVELRRDALQQIKRAQEEKNYAWLVSQVKRRDRLNGIISRLVGLPTHQALVKIGEVHQYGSHNT